MVVVVVVLLTRELVGCGSRTSAEGKAPWMLTRPGSYYYDPCITRLLGRFSAPLSNLILLKLLSFSLLDDFTAQTMNIRIAQSVVRNSRFELHFKSSRSKRAKKRQTESKTRFQN